MPKTAKNQRSFQFFGRRRMVPRQRIPQVTRAASGSSGPGLKLASRVSNPFQKEHLMLVLTRHWHQGGPADKRKGYRLCLQPFLKAFERRFCVIFLKFLRFFEKIEWKLEKKMNRCRIRNHRPFGACGKGPKLKILIFVKNWFFGQLSLRMDSGPSWISPWTPRSMQISFFF